MLPFRSRGCGAACCLTVLLCVGALAFPACGESSRAEDQPPPDAAVEAAPEAAPEASPEAAEAEAGVKHYPGVDFEEAFAFGDNPGEIDLFVHVPEGLAEGSPLVVVLHGCSQTAQAYSWYSQWNILADRYQFAVAYPQQRALNNGTLCFNWFLPGDASRDKGEAGSVAQMVAAMKDWYRSDPKRVFVTGVSAGAAMSVALAASYPDVFAGAASMAGLPFRAADTVAGATMATSGLVAHDAESWGDLVRNANPSWKGPWPRLIAFHGELDTVVSPANLGELVEQWVDVHGVPASPTLQEQIKGHTHQAFGGDSGAAAVESYSLKATGHGTPVDPGTGPDQGGEANVWFPDADLYSAYYACKFWGLAP